MGHDFVNWVTGISGHENGKQSRWIQKCVRSMEQLGGSGGMPSQDFFEK